MRDISGWISAHSAAVTLSPLLILVLAVAQLAAQRTPSAESQTPSKTTYDLTALEDMARDHNPTLIQASAHIRAEEARAKQAGLYPNPRVGYSAEQIGVEGTAGEFHGAFVQQEIVTAGKLGLSQRKYAARAEAARATEQAQMMRVLNDVRMHYWRVVGSATLVDIQVELEKNAEDGLFTVREMVNVGQANQADLHLATAAWQQARLNLQVAENDYRAARDRLFAVVGIDFRDATIEGNIEADPTLLDYQELRARLLNRSPQLQEARAKLRADELTVKREKAEPIPNIRLQGAVGRNFEATETVYAASVSVEIPIFDWNQGTVQQAKADLERQRAEVRRVELSLLRMMADQYRSYISAFQTAQDYRAVIVPEARSAYQQRLRNYEDNREDWPAVLTAERQFFESRSQYIQSLIQWREQEVAVTGMLLVDGLLAPSGPAPPGHIGAVPKPR